MHGVQVRTQYGYSFICTYHIPWYTGTPASCVIAVAQRICGKIENVVKKHTRSSSLLILVASCGHHSNGSILVLLVRQGQCCWLDSRVSIWQAARERATRMNEAQPSKMRNWTLADRWWGTRDETLAAGRNRGRNKNKPRKEGRREAGKQGRKRNALRVQTVQERLEWGNEQ